MQCCVIKLLSAGFRYFDKNHQSRRKTKSVIFGIYLLTLNTELILKNSIVLLCGLLYSLGFKEESPHLITNNERFTDFLIIELPTNNGAGKKVMTQNRNCNGMYKLFIFNTILLFPRTTNAKKNIKIKLKSYNNATVSSCREKPTVPRRNTIMYNTS